MHLQQFRRAPGYSLAFVTSLAIGIAAAGTAFAVVKRALIDPLPYPDADRLLTIQTVVDGREWLGSAYLFGEALRGSGPFADVSADWGRTVTYEVPEASERVAGGAVSENYFDVVGHRPVMGSGFTPRALNEVVLSWAFYQRALSGDPNVVGRSIVLNGVAHRVAGVMAPDFVAPYLSEAQLWLPLDVTPYLAENARGARGVILQARLAPGATLSDARAFLDAVAARQRAEHPAAYAGQSWTVNRLKDVLVEPSRTLLLGTAMATVLLVVIVLANIAGLSAARATDSRRAHAVRMALGAGQSRLFREQLTDSVVLAAAGTAAGLWLASGFITWVVGYQQQFQLFLEDVPAAVFDAPVVAVGIGIGLAAAAVAALLPQRALSQVSADELVGASRGFGRARSGRARTLLVVVQVAVAVVLVFAAGLLVRTMRHIDAAPLGFDTRGLLQFTVTLPASRYGTAARAQLFETALVERLQGVNGVEAATATFRMPVLDGPALPVTLPGRTESEPARAVWFAVAPGFFRAVGVAVRDGREFASTDAAPTLPVAVVSESMARAFWPEGRAVGARLRLGAGATSRDLTVVGVVADVRQGGPAQEVRPTIFESTQQRGELNRSFVFRTSRPAAAIAPDVRAAVSALDPLLATSRVETLESRLDSMVVQQRFVRSLLSLFAAVAAGLCALGLFAVVSLTAQARRFEFALRMALGAQARQVAWQVLRQSLVLGLAGGVIGVLVAGWLVGALRTLVTGVGIGDPVTVALTAAALLAVALVAAAPPAWRAIRIDPVTILKSN